MTSIEEQYRRTRARLLGRFDDILTRLVLRARVQERITLWRRRRRG